MAATIATDLQKVAEIRKRSRRRPNLAIVSLCALLIVGFFVRVLLGSYTVTLPDFFTIVSGGSIEGARSASFIVMEDKLPRAVMGVLVGLAFGVAGAIFQLLLRNPLASPDVIGISSGASMSAVIAMVFWGANGFSVSLYAIGGALLTAIIVMLLASGNGNVGNRFILMGIGVSALCGSVVSYLMARISLGQVTTASVWMSGSLATATWNRIEILLIALALITPFVMLWHKPLHMMAVGEELAHSLGLSTAVVRWIYIVLGVLLAAVATAAAGPVAFVAFVSGPIARNLVGGTHTLTGSALVGAIIMVFADFAAAELIPGGNLPVGIITGALGAPILIWLLVKAQKEQTA